MCIKQLVVPIKNIGTVHADFGHANSWIRDRSAVISLNYWNKVKLQGSKG